MNKLKKIWEKIKDTITIYLSYLILKMPWNDNKIILIDYNEDNDHLPVVIKFDKTDNYEYISQVFKEACEDTNFKPKKESCTDMIKKFSKRRLSLIVEGSFAG